MMVRRILHTDSGTVYDFRNNREIWARVNGSPQWTRIGRLDKHVDIDVYVQLKLQSPGYALYHDDAVIHHA